MKYPNKLGRVRLANMVGMIFEGVVTGGSMEEAAAALLATGALLARTHGFKTLVPDEILDTVVEDGHKRGEAIRAEMAQHKKAELN